MKHRFKRAFTITELVIVIAVIAILAAVLIPTFASVIDESKKSHDTQYMKEINVAIADYTATAGHAPQEYDELMLVLADSGLCDASNPFLLATELKQENMLLVWYPGTDRVKLLDTSVESLNFSSERGYGNYVLVGGSEIMESNGCYILCNRGHKDSMKAAEIYRQLYVLAGGNVNSFLSSNESIKDLVKDMENRSWANSIVSAVMNAKNGYTYDQNTAQSILDEFKTQNNAQLDLTQNLSSEDKQKLENNNKFEALSPDGQSALQQGVRGTLATLASLANDSSTKENISNKKVTLDVPEGTEVDMKEVTLTPIGHSYRKEEDVKTGTPKSTVSVDYGGVTLKNMNVPEDTFTSTGAEQQSEDDSGHPGGGYAFTYGLFGTVIAAPGQTVTIENLNLKNVYMNFKGAQEDINGNMVNTFADNAGIIVGYAQGNVVLKDITIDGMGKKFDKDGKEAAVETPGLIEGYDAIAGVVGRAYGAVTPVPDGKGGMKDGRESSSLVIDNVTIKNMNIVGERRASGFVGFISNSMNDVTIKNSTLENVTISCERHDDGKQIYQCWSMVFVDGSGNNVRIENNTLVNVKTGVNFFGEYLDDIDKKNTKPEANAKNGGTSDTWGGIGTNKYYYAVNPMNDGSQEYKYLTLLSKGSAYLTGNKFYVGETEYPIPDSTSESEKTGAGLFTLTAKA